MSDISFGIRKTRAWDEGTRQYSETPQRQADVYVFALLAHEDQPTLDPLNVAQWEFFVVPTALLNAEKPEVGSISLKALKAIADPPVDFAHVGDAVAAARGA